MGPTRRFLRRVVLLVMCLSLLSTGCVQRRMTIRSNPPGALVYIDDYYIGTTPVSTDFIYYGKRKIRLVKDGYETLNVPKYSIPPPWYQVFPLDFVSENVVPWEIRDERMLDFQLAPQVVVPQDQLLGRADQLRSQSNLNGAIVPAGGVLPPGNVPAPPTYLPPGPTAPQPLPPPVMQPQFETPQFQPALGQPAPQQTGPSTYPVIPPPNPVPLPGRY